MDVVGFPGMVVSGTVLDVGVAHHADVLQHGQRPIHGGRVDCGKAALDAAGHLLRRDVSIRAEYLLQDGLSLRGDPEAPLPEHRCDGAAALHGSQGTASASQVRRAEGGRRDRRTALRAPGI
jgi:hypothetical protein